MGAKILWYTVTLKIPRNAQCFNSGNFRKRNLTITKGTDFGEMNG